MLSKPAVLAMRAISIERTSRTVMDATTSPRASFSLTLLRRMSRICTAALPLFVARGYTSCEAARPIPVIAGRA
jgi:hypothetical protein